MMNEIKEIKSLANPIETILVADSLTGQVAGRIEKEKPVKDIINETINEFYETIEKFGNLS